MNKFLKVLLFVPETPNSHKKTPIDNTFQENLLKLAFGRNKWNVLTTTKFGFQHQLVKKNTRILYYIIFL